LRSGSWIGWSTVLPNHRIRCRLETGRFCGDFRLSHSGLFLPAPRPCGALPPASLSPRRNYRRAASGEQISAMQRRRLLHLHLVKANQTTSFFLVSGFASGAYSAKLFAGTKQRFSGFSQPRPPGRGGGGIPRRIMVRSAPVLRTREPDSRETLRALAADCLYTGSSRETGRLWRLGL
jgi:hypothetical protein